MKINLGTHDSFWKESTSKVQPLAINGPERNIKVNWRCIALGDSRRTMFLHALKANCLVDLACNHPHLGGLVK